MSDELNAKQDLDALDEAIFGQIADAGGYAPRSLDERQRAERLVMLGYARGEERPVSFATGEPTVRYYVTQRGREYMRKKRHGGSNQLG